MPHISIPPHRPTLGVQCQYLGEYGQCYWCCETCNLNNHDCPACGDPLDHHGHDLSEPFELHACLQDARSSNA